MSDLWVINNHEILTKSYAPQMIITTINFQTLMALR